ncbi:MAG: hypothetical protein V2I26_12050, partial [Halieaceae bacterium]|nr:hypothetical protein [Halieaceae bacterium]
GSPGAFLIELQTGGVAEEGNTDGNLDITVNPKDGTPYTKSFNCVPEPPPEEPEEEGGDGLGGVG